MESWINKLTEDKVKRQMRTVKPAAANSWLFPEGYLRVLLKPTSLLQPDKTAQAAMFLSRTKQGPKKENQK